MRMTYLLAHVGSLVNHCDVAVGRKWLRQHIWITLAKHSRFNDLFLLSGAQPNAVLNFILHCGFLSHSGWRNN